MKPILLCASLALAACTATPPVSVSTLPAAAVIADATLPPPATVADRTTLDEQAALAVELAYQAAATAVVTANRVGAVPAAAKPGIAAADRRAYAAVLAVRAAYDAGNATSYATAITAARSAVADLLTAIRS